MLSLELIKGKANDQPGVPFHRSSLYYTPKGESAESLALMQRIDELFLKHPFYGLVSLLAVSCKHITLPPCRSPLKWICMGPENNSRSGWNDSYRLFFSTYDDQNISRIVAQFLLN